MQSKREANRADLRKRLIDTAEAQIAEHGLKALTARDVTTQAGCALGALYNAFEDLDRLILHVNSRTLARLGTSLAASYPTDTGPKQALAALAQVYVARASFGPVSVGYAAAKAVPNLAKVRELTCRISRSRSSNAL